MKSAFPGFAPEAVAFLRDLKTHNDREWFTPRKSFFHEGLRLPMIELVRAIHAEMLRFAPEYAGDPVKSVFRIYRDTRFSKDKTPYKTHMAVSMWRNGADKNRAAGFYFSVSPEEIEIAGGVYAPEPDALLVLRQFIAEHHAEFRSTFEPRKVKALLGGLNGESVTRVPKGFDPAHPAIDLLKRKRFVLSCSLDPNLATSPKLFGEIVKCLEAMAPFVEFLDQPLRTKKPPVW